MAEQWPELMEAGAPASLPARGAQDVEALRSLSALSHEARLDAFRLLVHAGHNGMLAGEIAGRLRMRQNTMSTNLGILARAGLVKSRREGRGVRYRANMERMGTLLVYLLGDCCGGRPDLCDAVVHSLRLSPAEDAEGERAAEPPADRTSAA